MKEPRQAGQQAAPPAAPRALSELRVSGHLMTLEPGLFCIVQTPAQGADVANGLPGVRLSPPPGPAGRPEAVRISGFHNDGWLSGAGDAALVRVSGGPAQLLVTIYQAPDAGEGNAPNLQVMRLFEGGAQTAGAQSAGPQAAGAQAPGAQAAGAGAVAKRAEAAPSAPRAGKVMEIMAHIQERGDVGAMLGDWLGERGSKRWIEGFGIAPTQGVASKDIEYQAVLGKGWLSPWVEGGQFCGSRAMALPVLGLRVRLRGAAAEAYDLQYSATFVDGSEIGPVGDGEACEAESLAPLESFRVELRPRVTGAHAASGGTGPDAEGRPARDTSSDEKSRAKAPKPSAPEPAPARKRAAAQAAAPAAAAVAAPASGKDKKAKR